MQINLSNDDLFLILSSLVECQHAATDEGEFEAAAEYRRLAIRIRMYFINRGANEVTSV
jgi:hypothetical protein